MIVTSPLEQFQVLSVMSIFSNVWVYTAFYFLLFCFMFIFLIKPSKLSILEYPTNFGAVKIVKTLKNMLVTTTPFGNFFLGVYIVICFYLLFANVLGLTPLGFTLTAHMIISLSWAFFIFAWINIIFFFRFFVEWGSIFLPSGTPLLILPIIIPIEVLSYFSRILSLSIRLFANMMSGHTLLHILISFFYMNLTPNMFLFLPLLIIHLIMFMEVGVAFLQVYVFLVLIGLYLNDVRSYDTH